MGNASIDISLSSLYKSWYKFKKGKRRTGDFEIFEYYLEKNIFNLYCELNSGKYRHGLYHNFIVNDNKKRIVSVASIRDRIVHRLLYDYLVSVYDKSFIYDVWSCRKDKGLLGAIERTQQFTRRYRNHYVWRTDINKFFESIDQKILLVILIRKVRDKKTISLLKEVLLSYSSRERERERVKGLPIGNLTSQIFANIYLNELDRYIVHCKKPAAYLRYGDDFIIFGKDLDKLQKAREDVTNYIQENLKLNINKKNDILIKAHQGLKFLGVQIFPNGRKLMKRNLLRISRKLNLMNVPSYYGLIKQHNPKKIKEFSWKVLEIINYERV